MEVQLTPDQKTFVRQAMEAGRIRCEEDAVKEALSLWEERERRRDDVRQRGMARLAAEQTSR
jgi:Arc/MetJ-type ribon-helix-helix transcriptional regulator